jgi:glycine cleavage system regulatory protein
MTALTLTLIGRDRPGLVRALSERIAASGGNWLESRMARLAGQFAGVLLVEVPEPEADRLAEALRALGAEGLRVTVERGVGEAVPAQAAAPRHAFTLELVGQDRPGIVREVAQALAARGVNIEELTTEVATASFSGERLFRAKARLAAPPDAASGDLRDALEELAHELMVDLELEEAEAG